jgi:hypothetical protein
MGTEFPELCDGADTLGWALAYAARGLAIFPVGTDKKPLLGLHWREKATTDSATLEAWSRRVPYADYAWALPARVVVLDLDEKHGKRGLKDFARIAGCDPRSVLAPMSSTPSGGMQIFYAATRPYKNLAPAIPGMGLDTRCEGGFVVLPGPGNGRKWLRPFWDTPMPPAPAWLDCALKLTAQETLRSVPPPSDLHAQRKALTELERACARIVAAPCGSQDSTRHAQCFYIGGLIARGALDYAMACRALLAAARAMRAHRDPWRNLEQRVHASIEAGIGRPLPISEAELWLRSLRARLGAQRAALAAPEKVE